MENKLSECRLKNNDNLVIKKKIYRTSLSMSNVLIYSYYKNFLAPAAPPNISLVTKIDPYGILTES
jgi:hypothetical protein